MEIRGDLLTDKENAGAALLDACKEVKTSDPVQIGSYRGYAMSVEFSAWKQEYTLLLKGQMTHRATLGTDPRGNLTRIDNALAQMPQRLEAAKAQLDNLYPVSYTHLYCRLPYHGTGHRTGSHGCRGKASGYAVFPLG